MGFIYSWKMTLVTLTMMPVVFGGVYLESAIIKGQNLLEKKALENATKVRLLCSAMGYLNLDDFLIVLFFRRLQSKPLLTFELWPVWVESKPFWIGMIMN